MYLTLKWALLFSLFLVAWFSHGFYVLLFVTLIYIGLVYLRADDITGYATYDWLRRLTLWQRFSPILIFMGNEEAFLRAESKNQRRPHVFVVLPNYTNTALVWTFGLHGSGWPGVNHMRPCYIVPRCYFWVPVVREIMLATGAVSDRGKRSGQGLEDVVTDLLSRGRSVAYCPTGMADVLSAQRTDVIETRQPGLSLFRMALEKNAVVVPVLCDGENDRHYVFVTNRWIRRIQQWFLDRINYPWPLIYFPDWSGPPSSSSALAEDDEEYYDLESQGLPPNSGRQIDIQFGDALEPDEFQGDAEAMQRAFFQRIQEMTRETKEVVFKV